MNSWTSSSKEKDLKSLAALTWWYFCVQRRSRQMFSTGPRDSCLGSTNSEPGFTDSHILHKYHGTSVTWLLIDPVHLVNKDFCKPTGLEIGAEECDEETLQVCRCGDLTRPPPKSNLCAVLPSASLKHRLSSKPPTKADFCNLCRPSGTSTNGCEGVF